MSDMCFFGFDRGNLHLKVDGPRGPVHDSTFCFSCGKRNAIAWPTFPGDALGDYSVRVTQGSTVAAGTFRLVAAETPVVLVAESPGRGVKDIPAGSAVRIGLTAFPPSTEARVAIYYGATARTFNTYVTTLTIGVDNTGTAVQTLATQPDDPAGCYTLETIPRRDPQLAQLYVAMNGFCLR